LGHNAILTEVKGKRTIGIYEIPSNSLETAALPTRSTGKNRRGSARFETIAPRAICIFLCSAKRNACFADDTPCYMFDAAEQRRDI